MVEFPYQFPNIPTPTINAPSLDQAKKQLSAEVNSRNDEEANNENDTKNTIGLETLESTAKKLTPDIVNGYVKNSPVLVSFEKYEDYIDAVYKYINHDDNKNTYKEGIDRARNGNWDSAALIKMIGRTDNQIMNDMVFHIFISYHLLNDSKLESFTKWYEINDSSLDEEKKAKAGKLIRYIDDYRKTIETDLGEKLFYNNDKLTTKTDKLMFFIPNSLPKKGWSAAEHKKILSAERLNKTNFNTFPWPSSLLNFLIYLFEKLREIMIKRGINNKMYLKMYFRYLEFFIIKLKKLLLGSQKKKCLRLNRLLTTDVISLGYNYNVSEGNVDNLNDNSCDKKHGLVGTRCRRLVDARIKISQNFDKDCNIRETARGFKDIDNSSGLSKLVTNVLTALSTEPKNKTGGKKNKTRRPIKQRKTRKLRKNIGGNDGDAIILILILIVGFILLSVGGATANLPLAYAGAALTFIVLIIMYSY
jgi:hypothetical protein